MQVRKHEKHIPLRTTNGKQVKKKVSGWIGRNGDAPKSDKLRGNLVKVGAKVKYAFHRTLGVHLVVECD